MADCVQMLKDWKRMCNAITVMDGCEDCPIVRNTHGARCGDMPCEMQDVESIAREVEKWAAEHPIEYPYMFDILQDVFGMPKGLSLTGIWEWINTIRIPADIADKLGVQPKEE